MQYSYMSAPERIYGTVRYLWMTLIPYPAESLGSSTILTFPSVTHYKIMSTLKRNKGVYCTLLDESVWVILFHDDSTNGLLTLCLMLFLQLNQIGPCSLYGLWKGCSIPQCMWWLHTFMTALECSLAMLNGSKLYLDKALLQFWLTFALCNPSCFHPNRICSRGVGHVVCLQTICIILAI